MIKAGFATDKKHAYALYKTAEDGTCSAGMTLVGFGTQPMPGEICEDGIAKATQFAAHYIQKALEALLSKGDASLELAKATIATRLTKLNDSIAFISRNLGQGIYLSGTVYFIAAEQYLCVSFGGACVYRWYMGEGTLQEPTAPNGSDETYITNAIGGTHNWQAAFCEGSLPVGSQLLCMTQQPPEDLLPGIMSELIRTNQVVLPVSIYKGLVSQGIPLAVLTVAQTADYSNKTGGDGNDE